MSGSKIIEGLRDAVAGNFASVTIEGQTWVRRDWQDIGTAPRDGTSILLWFPWTYSKSPHAPDGFIYIGKWHSPDDGADGWYDPVDYEEIGKEPTHWQPLPAPPSEGRG